MSTKIKFKNYTNLIPLFLIQVVWGSYFLIAKDLQKEVNIYFLHFARFLLLSIIFLPFALKYLKDKRLIMGGIVCGLLLAANNYLLNLGLNITLSVNAAFIIGLSLVFTTLIEALIFKEKMNKFKWIASASALIGMWFITGGVKGFDLGDAILILSTIFGAFHVIGADKYLDQKSHVIAFVFWQMIICAIVGLFMAIFFGNFNLPPLTTTNISEFLYIALVSMGLGMVVLMWTQERVNPIIVSLIFLFETIFGAIIGWTFGHEPFIISQAFGGVGVLIAMLLTVLSDTDADLKSIA